MADLALTEAERAVLASLEELGVRYLVVGLSAAVIQGADTTTADIDLWFEDRADPRIHEAARRAGGVFVPGSFGMMPPTIGGDALGDRFDVVLTLSGLEEFSREASRALRFDVDGISLPVLPLERVIHSKRAAGRRKDLAVLPALEAALAAGQDPI
jgi:predicted nucleotidyltransferase